LGGTSASEVLIKNASYILISQYSYSIFLPLFLEQLLLKLHLVVLGFFFLWFASLFPLFSSTAESGSYLLQQVLIKMKTFAFAFLNRTVMANFTLKQTSKGYNYKSFALMQSKRETK